MSIPLDQHCVTQIEVSIVYMERLVSTRYVALWNGPSLRLRGRGGEGYVVALALG
jgi:hypothetical protein